MKKQSIPIIRSDIRSKKPISRRLLLDHYRFGMYYTNYKNISFDVETDNKDLTEFSFEYRN